MSDPSIRFHYMYSSMGSLQAGSSSSKSNWVNHFFMDFMLFAKETLSCWNRIRLFPGVVTKDFLYLDWPTLTLPDKNFDSTMIFRYYSTNPSKCLRLMSEFLLQMDFDIDANIIWWPRKPCDCLNDIKCWTAQNFLRRNDSKTEMLHIPPSLQWTGIGPMYTNTKPSARNLRILFDYDLTHLSAACQ